MSIDNVTDLTPRDRYVASAAQVDFDYGFPIFEDADLVVLVDDVAQTLTTDYSVTGEGDDLGGTVTFVTPMTGGEIVTIYRDTAIERTSDVQQHGPIASSTFNDEFDKAYTIMQELKAKIGRAIRFPFTAEQSDEASELTPLSNWYSKFLYVGSTGLLEPASIVSSEVALTQDVIGRLLYPQTTAEVSAGVTPTNYAWPECYVYRYGTNTTPGTTDMTTAINHAIQVANARGGGQVIFPPQTCKISSTIAITQPNVQLIGQGMASQIKADSCDGITISGFTSYQSITLLRDLYIKAGTGASTHTGITVPGTTNSSTQIYGVILERVVVDGFNVGVHTRSVWHFAMLGSCRIENCDRGIEITGLSILNVLEYVRIVRGSSPGGAGSSTGILVDQYNYSTGGVQWPESVDMIKPYVFGFETTINVNACNECHILHPDLAPTQVGIDFTTAQLIFEVLGGYIEVDGAGGVAGIIGRSLGSGPLLTKLNLKGISVNAVGTCPTGIQINGVGGVDQSFYTIESCYVQGMTTTDILVINSGNGKIYDNRCGSGGAARSIVAQTVQNGTVRISENLCTKNILTDAADETAGKVLRNDNIVSGTTLENYGGVWVSPTFSAGDYTASGSMTWTVANGDVATYEYMINRKTMTVNFAINTSTVAGTPSTTLKIAIPASKVAAHQTYNACGYFNDNGTVRPAMVSVVVDGTTINIDRTDGSNMTAATDSTYAKGSITFQIK